MPNVTTVTTADAVALEVPTTPRGARVAAELFLRVLRWFAPRSAAASDEKLGPQA